MKTQLITLIFIIFAFSFSYAQSGWEWQNPLPQGTDLFSTYFINDSTGFVGGRSGTILKTINSGATWTFLKSGTYANLTSMYFTSPNVGYAAGGGLIKTIDGGENWFPVTTGSTYILNAVCFSNTNNGLVVGNYGNLFKTTDGGGNWIKIALGTTYNLNTIFFLDNNNCFVAGDGGVVLKSTNAGTTWTSISIMVNKNITSIFFTDINTGYVVGANGMIMKTTNGGISWGVQTSGTPFYLMTVHFMDTNNGYAVGFGGKILHTSNGGINWVSLTNGIGANLHSSSFIDSNNAYIVGAWGTIIKISNGTNCTSLSSGSVSSLNSIYFSTDSIGYTSSRNGTILKTSDAGTNWTSQSIGLNSGLNSIFFIDQDNGFAVGDSGFVIKTTDAGNSWNQKNIGYDNTLKSTYFIDSNNGFIAGSNGKIFKTIDGGITWDSLYCGTNISLNSICFTDINTGFVVGGDDPMWGNEGIILKTIDGGQNWVQMDLDNNYGLLSVYFIDSVTGYAAGYFGIILKTTDSGENWALLQTDQTIPFYSVFFTDNNNGYAAGTSQTIIKTNDGGLSWGVLRSNQSYSLKSAFFTSTNIGYVVGDCGFILKTYTGGEYVNTSIDSLKVLTIQNNSANNNCQLPYQSEICLNTLISGPSYIVGDSINYHLWFGDGSDTIFTKTVENIPSYIAAYINHTYQFHGVFSVKCKVTAPDGRTDSLTVNELIIVSGTCGNISGTVYSDANSNCIKDSLETGIANRKVSLFHNSQLIALTYTNSAGIYSFDVPDNTDYTVVLDTTNLLGYTLLCPASANYTVNTFPAINQDFALHCGMAYDLDTYLAGNAFRPGFNGNLQLNIKNNSCNPYNGNISVKLDSLTSFNYSFPAPAQIIGDSLVWNFTNLTNQQDIHIPISLYTSTSAWIGDSVCFTVTVAPVAGDNDTSNNVQQYCFPIVNSWDPNEKEVSPRGDLSGDTTLTYTIHFQNTGNAEAYNIFILDTIDSNLDLSSLRIISYSHPMTINVINEQPKTILKFNFQNIMLHDSGTNNLQSMGYVTYSLRTKTGLPHETSIKNTAHIYFDFNPAIITNTVESKIMITGISKVKPMIDVTLYPNPTNDKIYIQSQENLNVRVYNLLGTNIYTGKTTDCNFVNLSQKGIYLFELSNEKGMVYKKVVVQ